MPASDKPRSPKLIRIRGARQHNLKNLDLDIPRDRLTVITGLSGAGKSSLAFDTIYAEGQRKYVESLSVRARQYLEQMPKPDADRIDGLSPTIAIDQRATSRSPRGTVATVTEIYDYLRLLFARVGQPRCWECGRVIGRQSVSFIVDRALSLPHATRFIVLAPLIRQQRGAHADLLSHISRQGYVRARIDGKIHHLEDVVHLSSNKKHDIDVVVDRLSAKEGVGQRVADSIEQALSLSKGRVIIAHEKDGAFEDEFFSTSLTCPHHPEVDLGRLTPRMFSFNSPLGACPDCHGLGSVLDFDPDLIVPDRRATLAGGAIACWPSARRSSGELPAKLAEFCQKFEVAPEATFRNLPDDVTRILLHGTAKCDVEKYGSDFVGVIPSLRQRWEKTDSDSVKQRLMSFQSSAPCPTCGGARLRPESLAVKIDSCSIYELCNRTVSEARKFFDELRFEGAAFDIAEAILRDVRSRLRYMCDLGVGYLTLDRSSATLSGGEAQRIRLANLIGSGLVGVCYVLDEPTVGLHQRDSRRLVATLRRLTRSGNTVIVVEHDDEVIAAADHIIDLGPQAGERGGELIGEGDLNAIIGSPRSVTGKYLSGERALEVPSERRSAANGASIEIFSAMANNLKGFDVRIPLGRLVCVTGVSGSGKSTLIMDILLRTVKRVVNGSGPQPGEYRRLAGAHQINRIIEIDQSPIGRSPRSNPATFVGVFDVIRDLYAQTREARIRGYSASRFSFNVKGGRCEDCQGQGTRRIEMHFLPDMYTECDTCHGSRYNRETLEVRFRGKSIAQILEMSIEEAARFFAKIPRIRKPLRALQDVGLGYLKLGQPSTTLSGGEAQRIKIAAELGKTASENTMYILDEPTTGLHLADVERLTGILHRLVGAGHSVIVIEHHLDLIKTADWVIDLGPGAGDQGGEIVAQGTPEEVAESKRGYTSRYLAERLSGSPPITFLRAAKRALRMR